MICLNSTLLIVESSVTNITIYQDYLRSKGCSYNLSIVASMAEGLDFYHTSLVDAVLLGCSVSSADALAFLELLSQGEGARPAVVIVATENDASIAVRALKLGAHDYLLERDLNPELLHSAIASAIDKAHLEIQLLESNNRLRLAVESANLGTIDFNLLTGQVIWNATAEVFMGYVPGAAAAYSYADFEGRIHPADRARVTTDLARVTIDLPDSTADYRVIWADGSVRWHRGFGRFYYDDDGRAVRMLGTIEDITDRKQAELDLLESEHKFSAIFNQTFEFIGLLSLDGVLLEVNQAALDSVGTSRAEIVGKNFWETPWWTHSQELQQQLKTSIERAAHGEFICYEVSFPAANGDMMTTNFSLKPVCDERGRVTTLVGEGYDITDRKRTEAALLESEARFRSTFEQAAVGIAHVGLDGRWLTFNQKLCDIVGYTEVELLDSKFQEITHPDDLALNLEYVRQLVAGEIQTYVMEKRYIHKLGRIVWVNLTVSLRRDPLGKPLHFISIVEDINDRKQIELDLQTQKVELAKTTALLELRNQELSRFSHTVSHDLKAPLRAISNLAAWIEDDLANTIDPATQRHLALMRSRISRMETLIDGLLDYAKVGNTATSLETFTVADLLTEIVDLLSIPDSFVVELPANLPPITTNRLLLGQVLANLLGNAYKHHDRADGRIRVTTQPQAKMWEFSVTDDGCGIAPENQERVFDIFKTLSGADKNNTGIGLSIVKKIVEAQGGNITLESQLGVGTTFYFTWRTDSLA